MENILKLWELLTSPAMGAVIMCLFLVSETLGELEYFKQSSIFGYVRSALKFLKDKFGKKPASLEQPKP